MKLPFVLILASTYMALLGLGFVFAPQIIGIDAVPVDASPALVAFLRMPGPAFIAIAVLNFLARNSEASPARNAIVVANIVGFSLAAVFNVVAVLTGGRYIALAFAAVHVTFAVLFIVTGRSKI
ncbi:MAG: hypothetical protein KGJ59_10080 [Bacteroidota bacterium]|nr:hypothetical protein [Bacteroidota bacterium]